MLVKNKAKIIIGFLIVTVLLSVCPFVSRAEETSAVDDVMITVPFFSAGMWEMKWDFPYSDSYFLLPDQEFSRDIAKASLGLTVSAFREGGTSTVSNQYETYLGEAGFQDIYAFGYDKPTTPETLSGVIASKKIGDFTLIAASPCGQGYEKEWGGNLEIGNGIRHAGFDKGALILEREIRSYIEEHKLTGKLKLWISSFSRGSAVANLAAADLIEEGIFDNVYAYLYAVPRTTKDAKSYANIINICGANDPVTQIPLESWGYSRNGWDLYLPSAETTVEFYRMEPYVEEVTQAVANDSFRYNQELNYQLHLIIEVLGEMFPDTEDYTSKIQEEITSLWTEARPEQMFLILESVFASLDDLDQRQEYSRDVIIAYLEQLASEWLKDTRESKEKKASDWATDQGMAANLMREHMPYIYLSWIFSDLTDEQLTQGSFSMQRLTVIGNVDVEIWQDNVFLNGLDQNGEAILKEGSTEEILAEENRKSVFVVRNGLLTMVVLPQNADFQVRILIDDSLGFNYRADACYLPSTYGTSDGFHVVAVTPGTYELQFFKYEKTPGALTALDGDILNESVSNLEYSPTLAMWIQMDAAEYETKKDVITNMVFLLAAVIVLLLVCLVIAIVHKVKKKTHGPYSSWYVLIPHYLLLLLFVWLTIYCTKSFYLITALRVAFAAASGLILFLLSLRGLIRNRTLPNVLMMVFVLLLSVLNVTVYQHSQIVGNHLIINIVYCLLMAGLAALASAGFWIRKKQEKT